MHRVMDIKHLPTPRRSRLGRCAGLSWLALLAAFFWASPKVQAQQDAFPADPEGFVQAFSRHLKDTQRPDLVEVAQALQARYADGSLEPGMATALAGPANTLVARRMAPATYLLPFSRSAVALAANAHGWQRFERWLEVTESLLEGQTSPNNKALQTWLEFSAIFYGQNALHASRTRTWEIDAPSWEFRLDGQRVEVFFPLAELYGIVTGDTVVIQRARGSYYPQEDVWRGVQGRIDFARAGLNPEQVYADFRAHTINLGSPELTIDTALLTYKPLLDKPLAGRLNDKLVVNNKTDKTEYPQFLSFGDDPLALNLYPNVRYRGAFALKGFRFQGYGSGAERAVLEFLNKQDQVAVRARTSRSIVDDRDRIYSDQAQVTVYLGGDSIYHPNVKLRFDQATGQLSLSRENKGATSSPFYSTYHRLETSPDELSWNINDSVMTMGPSMGLGRKEIDFRSINLFDDELFVDIQGVVSYHPLVIMKRLVDRSGGRREFGALELAHEFNRSLTVAGVQAIYYQLMLEGFIYYDKDKELVTVLDKTINFVLSKGKKIDYDAINIRSDATTSGYNSRLNMQSGAMELSGVFEVNLSDSQFVRVFPQGKRLLMQGNRDMQFGGTVFGGSADFYGQDFYFRYDSFSVAMQSIDSMVLYVPTGEVDANGRPITKALNTTISGLSGTLYIDHPKNKSGVEDYGDYPYFRSDEVARAHYEKPGVQGGAYDQERFFFAVDDFSLDSLDQVDPSRLGFAGTLNSDGIFPELRQTITVMEDRSLGFETETPAEGYPLYGQKARFFDQISLSNEGLLGKGRIEYLSAVLESERFVFFPDSALGKADNLQIKRQDKGVAFPEVSNTGVAMRWLSAADSMYLNMGKTPFAFFGGLTNLEGNLTLTPGGLRGAGVMDWAEARASSREFRFGAMFFEADSSGFVIKSPEADRAALVLPNAYARFDFDKRQGIFRANDDVEFTELPFNRYLTTVNDFNWDLAEGRINFQTTGRDYSLFRSQDKRQKGLQFSAQSGSYVMQGHVLQLSGVPYIAVGDAHVVPKEGEVTIEQDAVIRQLEGASIVFDSLYAYHVIEPASVRIAGKHNMYASGDYRYVNRLDMEQIIHFGDIGTERIITQTKDTLYETVARGVIPDSLPLFLDPKVLYKGPVSLRSSSEKVAFNGFAKLNLSDTTYRAGWFQMSEDIEADNFLISIDGVVNDRKDSAVVGIYRLFGDTQLYPSILAGKRRAKDKEVMRVRGFVQFQEDIQSFVFGDPDKVDGFSNRGSMMAFNDETGEVQAEGRLNLTTDFGLCRVDAAGHTRKSPQDTVWSFQTALAIKLLLTPELLQQFGKTIYDYNADAEYLDYFSDSSSFLLTFPSLLSDKDEQLIMGDIQTMAEFNPSKDYPYDLTLSDVPLIWNEQSESWRTPRFRAGLAHIGTQSMNQEIVLVAEFAPRAAGDYFHLYLETEMEDWFYFYYNKNILKVISSLGEFNSALGATDPKDMTFRHGNTQVYSVLTAATVAERNRFLSKMGYFGEEGE
jgi:hypothetical protein